METIENGVPDLAVMFVWPEPREVQTKRGPRLLRKIRPDPEFWSVIWARFQWHYKAHGFSASEDLRQKGKFDLCWWQPLEETELQKRSENKTLSRAADTDFAPPVPPRLEYFPYQKAGIRYALDKDACYIADEMGLGKALAVTEPVLTPQGWVPMGELKAGSRVIGLAGEYNVIGYYPQGVIPTVNVRFRDGTTVRCSRDHLWTVHTRNTFRRGQAPITLTAEEMLQKGLRWRNGTAKYFVQQCEPIPGRLQPTMAPYLLGYLLGNGSLEGTPAVSSPHAEARHILKNFLPPGVRIEGPYPSDPNKYHLTGGNKGKANPLTEALRTLGVWNTHDQVKFIPDVCFEWHAGNRLDLLRGLMDSDGTTANGRSRFCSCSHQLASGVRRLVLSLGGIAAIANGQEPYGNGKLRTWTVTICLSECPFLLEYHRKRFRHGKSLMRRFVDAITEADPAECACIAVDSPDHLYLTRDYVPTHNTIQAIGVINTDETIERVLVLTKASLKENWRRELSKWLVDKMDIGIAEGQKWPRKADIVIANYDILGKHFHALREKPWDLIILDESQYLSEPKNKRTKAVIGFTPSKKKQEEGEVIIPPIPARRKIALSGTPIENNEIDIWPVLNYLAPHRFPSYWGFAFKFCGAVKQEWGGIAWTGEKKPAALQDLLRSTMMIRRLKRDVAKELPAKTRMVIELDTEGLEDVLSDDYKAWQKHGGSLEEAQADLELARAGDSEEAFRDRVRDMKEAKFAFDELALIRKKTALAKLPKVIPLLKDDVKETAGKCLIFAHHHEVIDQLRKEFPRSVCITGSTPAASRQAIVDRFQNDPRCGPFIGSIRACGEGLNLTAASVVDFVEEDWTPSKICQAEDRAHRIGQKDNVTVKHYIVPGTCDARMLQVTLAKQEMIERTIDLDPESWVAEPLLAPHDSLGKRKDLQEEGLLITSSEIHAIKAGLLILAMMCDGGVKVDGVGFSKVDAAIGRRLAHLPSLTGPQAALGRRLCVRYRRQLGEANLAAMGAPSVPSEPIE